MDRTATLQTMAILKAAYPAFYGKMPPEELNGAVSVWQDAFSDVPAEIVGVAVRSLIKTHSGYPPDIAAIHSEIRQIISAASGEPTDEELWHIYKRAVQNSGYCENETFEGLPPLLQKYCGSARTLYEHAMMPLDTFNSVIHGQFLRQLPILRQRQEYRDSLPEPVVKLIADIRERTVLPPPQRQMTPREFDENRNKVIAGLSPPVMPVTDYVPIDEQEFRKRKQDILFRLDSVRGNG